MWTKTLVTTFQGKAVPVQVWLNNTLDDKEEVRVQAMLNEFYLIESILFESRDAAYDFIANYPASMAKAFVLREAYASGAVE